MDKLSSALRELEKSDLYPFHMPGHKRRATEAQLEECCLRDITEIDGFDNLHHPEGIIRDEQEFAAKLFRAEESFFLVNGSSCGVLGAIFTVAENSGSRILMSRNAHKSAYNGLYLANIQADYLYPEEIPEIPFSGPVSVESVKKALDCKRSYTGIFITSPTYEGVVSDIKAICKLAHSQKIPVIVDEAHGAHLGIWGGDGYFPESALAQGADIVIQSLHKTLPAMTQTAILHVQGNLINRQKLKMHLGMFQSSSPSYILMESIASCLHFCSENRNDLIRNYENRLQNFYQEVKNLSSIRVFHASQFDCLLPTGMQVSKDPGKIVVETGKSGLTGKQLYDILREKYHLQMEMAASDYVIAMTSVMDTEEGFRRLSLALKEIDAQAEEKEIIDSKTRGDDFKGESLYSIKEAIDLPGREIALENSEGAISKEFIYLYPPGIPLIVPGERICPGLPAYIKKAAEAGLSVQGLRDYEQKNILCVYET